MKMIKDKIPLLIYLDKIYRNQILIAWGLILFLILIPYAYLQLGQTLKSIIFESKEIALIALVSIICFLIFLAFLNSRCPICNFYISFRNKPNYCSNCSTLFKFRVNKESSIMFIKKIFDPLVPKVLVELTSNEIIFKYKEKKIQLLPVIYLSKDEKQPIILDVGSSTGPINQHIRIEIFGANNLESNYIRKEDCLKSFVLHALRGLISPRSFVRPKILIKNSEILNDKLCGYQEMLLREAFIFAGAMDCSFI